MLKSLGATIAQVTQRIGGAADPSLPDDERSRHAVRRAERRRQLKTILVLLAIFVVMVALFSTVFHELMDREGRSFSWPTSVYWTLTTMTTLGFGDITFESDAGRVFSVVVLLSGSAFLLVMLPFVFIQFVFIPWMNDREARRAPRRVDTSTTGHLILTSLGPVEEDVIEHATRAEVPYVVVVDDVEAAGRLHDEGRRVMVGPLDDPETYRHARVQSAALVVATQNDQTNTNIAFTVREIAPDVGIVASANSPAAVDILEIAGADRVVQLGEVLGAAMAARALGLGGRTHVIGNFGGLCIAEAGVVGTDLVGATLGTIRLRERINVGIIGVWERGEFTVASADTELRSTSLLILAGSESELRAFDEAYAVDTPAASTALIIGGGRVGRAIAATLADEGVEPTIIEQLPERQRSGTRYVIGDAADRAVLEEAGIDSAGSILITTHDDNVNVYLTRYCRGLRPDARIVSRSRQDRNVSTLYRAGADAVLSYAATGSAAIWNHFRGDETLLVAHGLNVFRSPMPAELAGRTLAEVHLQRRTGCNVVALDRSGDVRANPDPHVPLPTDAELLLVATDAGESSFSEVFPHARRRLTPDMARRRR
ncbi:MAG: NAD-binding protein [Actinomycetota bacterium]